MWKDKPGPCHLRESRVTIHSKEKRRGWNSQPWLNKVTWCGSTDRGEKQENIFFRHVNFLVVVDFY